jgi:leucyl aminopeptidase (aminopeptidase T)
VVLHFAGGRIERIEAAAGAEGLRALFDVHTGESRRVSHVGLGLNPYLHQLIGWTLVDVRIRGCLLICLGENRYLGGQNASSLNVHFAIPGATLQIDGRTIVSEGTIVLQTHHLPLPFRRPYRSRKCCSSEVLDPRNSMHRILLAEARVCLLAFLRQA